MRKEIYVFIWLAFLFLGAIFSSMTFQAYAAVNQPVTPAVPDVSSQITFAVKDINTNVTALLSNLGISTINPSGRQLVVSNLHTRRPAAIVYRNYLQSLFTNTSPSVANTSGISTLKTAASTSSSGVSVNNLTGSVTINGVTYASVSAVPDDVAFAQQYLQMSPFEQVLYRSYIVSNVDGSIIDKILAILKSSNLVSDAKPDQIVKLAQLAKVPNDTYYSLMSSWGQNYDDMWALKSLNPALGWQVTTGKGVLVAVVDTGADLTHEDLTKNIWVNPNANNDGYIGDLNGFNFVNPQVDAKGNITSTVGPIDEDGHGTHVAGIIAALGNNGKGVIGVAPDATIMAVKVFGSGNGNAPRLSDLAKGIRFAADHGAKVINCSFEAGLTNKVEDDDLKKAIKYAVYVKDAVVVAAAGNHSVDSNKIQPALDPNVIDVGASTTSGTIAKFSNFNVDLLAPGGDGLNGLLKSDGSNAYQISTGDWNILSLRAKNTDAATSNGAFVVGNNYYRDQGTSQAAPFVSGLAALLRAAYPSADNQAIQFMIKQGVSDKNVINISNSFGLNGAYAYLTPSFTERYSGSKTVNGTVNITGAVFLPNTATDRYEVVLQSSSSYQTLIASQVSALPTPATAAQLVQGSSAFVDPILYQWDTTKIADGSYTIYLNYYYGSPQKKYQTTASFIVQNKSGVIVPPAPILNEWDPTLGQHSFDVNTVDRIYVPYLMTSGASKSTAFPYNYQAIFTAQDPSSTISLTNLPPGATYDPVARIFSWTPSPLNGALMPDLTTYATILTVKDKNGVVQLSKNVYFSLVCEDDGLQLNNFISSSGLNYIASDGQKAYYLNENGTEIKIEDLTQNQSDHQNVPSITQFKEKKANLALANNKLFWINSTSNGSFVRMLDLASQKLTTVSQGGHAFIGSLSAAGTKAVWSECLGDGTLCDIWVYDSSALTLNKLQSKMGAATSQNSPYTDGNRVVFLNVVFSQIIVSLYDLTTNQESYITAEPFFYIDLNTLRLSGNLITWREGDDSQKYYDPNIRNFFSVKKIYYWDIKARTKKSLAYKITSSEVQNGVGTNGSRIAFFDSLPVNNASSNSRFKSLYYYDLARNQSLFLYQDFMSSNLLLTNRDIILWSNDYGLAGVKLAFAPFVSAVSSTSMLSNKSVTITGEDLGTTQGQVFYSDDTNQQYPWACSSWTSTQVTCTPPFLPIAKTATVTLYTATGGYSNPSPSITVGVPPTPDLSVPFVTWGSDVVGPLQVVNGVITLNGGNFILTGTITNIGKAVSPATVVNMVVDDALLTSTSSMNQVKSLKPGESTSFTITTSLGDLSQGSTHSVSAIVNSNSSFLELNYDNNVSSNFSVYVPPSTGIVNKKQ